jgi:hypothetical protein
MGGGGHIENVVNAARFEELVLENWRVTVVSRKQELEVKFRNNEEVAVGIREWLRMQEPAVYLIGSFKLVPRWDECIHVLGNYVEK